MKLLKEINKKESGQAFILALIMLLVGGLIIAPLMGFMATGLIAGQAIEKNMNEVFADDAGIEDGIYNIFFSTAPEYDDLQALGVNDSHSYTLINPVNGEAVVVTVTKKTILSGLIDDGDYKLDTPHGDWIDFIIPEDEIVRDHINGWVEYTCYITITHDGGGNATIESIGAFFSPITGDPSMVNGPYGYTGTETGVMDFALLESGSPETKFASGGFAFIWRFVTTGPDKIVLSTSNPSAGFTFKFKVYDSDWEYGLYFVWSVVTRQDISFATNAPGLYKWVVEATAGDTTVRAVVLEQIGDMNILIWEINPPQ